MTRAFSSNDVLSGTAAFLAYAAGMGLVLCAITMALSLARGGLVAKLRSAQGHINTISGVLLVIAGAYLAYYGWWESRVLADPRNPPPAGPVDLVTDASDAIRNWVTSIGAERIGIVLAMVIGIVVVLTVGLRTPESLDRDDAPSGRGA